MGVGSCKEGKEETKEEFKIEKDKKRNREEEFKKIG
jgi:hypothetical protein